MKLYKIVIAPAAKKQIDKLSQKTRERMADVVDFIAQNPFIGKVLKADLKGLYSYRMGDYRIIYSILKHELIIHVVKVMHRREAYR